MSQAIDERIVAAKFDASDFEKGVNKTLKKLDELKKGLDFKEATKGVKELAEKTEVSTDSMSKSLEKLTDRFTNFAGMIKQKILSGLADEVANVFLKMEQSVKGFIKSISSDQVSAGMSKYEQMLTSVRIMMSAGESQDSAYAAIGQLRDYSDQTSYSLSQMTDALSKLRAAGVDIDTATRSVEGIANACANAGINATDAQRAFFNLSQAYSSGVLKYTDYRSLELLNMTTENFKEQILEAAVNANTLKKVSDGVYQTINKGNKKVIAGKKVTKQNLQDMLRYNFVTSEVMNELFGGTFFFDEGKFKEYKKKYKTLDDAIAAAKKDYGETAVNAYLAAREARSFTDVLNTLKDVVSTGWSTTFEHLFGKLEEAKDFFTHLAEGELADVIYKIGEYRNAVLGYWDDLDPEGRGSGGEVLRQSILNITDAIGTLLKTFEQLLPGFDELNAEEGEAQPVLQKLGDRLFELTMNFRDFSKRVKEAAEKFNEFMNSRITEDGPTRIELIRQVIANLASVFGIIGKVVSIAFSTISKAFYTLSPVFDGFLQLLEKVTEPLVGLKDNTEVFNGIQDSINNILKILDPVAKTLGTILGFLGEIGAFIAQMALDTVTSNITFFADVLGIVMELITGNSAQMERGEGVLDRIRKDFEGIKNACSEGLGAIKNFFGALISDIRTLLGLSDGSETDSTNQNGGIFANLTNFFNTNEFVQKAKAWVSQAIIDVGDFIKSIPERVKKFGANIYDTLRSLFFTEQTRYNGSQLETKTVLTPLGEWLAGVIENIKNFIISIPQRIIDGIGKLGNWIDDVFNSIFGDETTKKADKSSTEAAENAVASYFYDFIQSIFTSIREWFNDLPNKIRTGLSSIGDFFSKVYEKIDEFLFGKKIVHVKAVKNDKGGWDYKTVTKRYKTGFSKFLDGIIVEVKKFINNIPEYIKSAIKGAGDIVSVVVNALFGKDPNDKTPDSKDVQEKLEAPFLGIDIGGILATIKDIGVTILNQIARIFTGSEDIEANQEWFSNLIAEGIEWIRDKAEKAFDLVLEFISTLPTRIANLFSGENTKEQGPVGKAISDFGIAVGGFIASLPETISTFLTNALKEIGNVWDTIYNSLIGSIDETGDKVSVSIDETSDKVSSEVDKKGFLGVDWAKIKPKEKSKWESFVESVGKLISTAFEKLPVWIANGIELAVIGINELIGNIGNWLENIDLKKDTEEGSSSVVEGAIDGIAKSTEEEGEKGESKLFAAIVSIGDRIKTLIIETLPTFIQQAWTKLSELGTEIWSGISSVFTGEVPTSTIGKAIRDMAINIYNFITTDIPEYCKKAFRALTGLFSNNNDDWKRNIVVPNMSDYVISEVEKQQNQAKKKTEGVGFFGFISNIGSTIVKAFEKLGPTILNGIASALDFLGDIAGIIVDALTGKKSIGETVEEAYGKEQPELKSALTKIGESLKKFFLESVPQFIGAAIGTLIANADEWFSKLFAGMNTAMNDAAEKAEKDNAQSSGGVSGGAEFGKKGAIESVTDFISTFVDNITKIVGDHWLTALGIMIGITLLFKALRDILSIADEMESVGYVIKWGAITIAISAIAGICAAISDVVKNGDDAELERFDHVIDKVGELLEKLQWIFGFMAASKLFETLGNIKWLTGGNVTNILGNVTGGFDFIGIIGNFFTNFFGATGLGAGIDVGSRLAGAGISSAIDTISSSVSGAVTEVNDIMSELMPFIDELDGMTEKIDNAIDVAGKVKDLFAAFYTSFSTLYEEAADIVVTQKEDENGVMDYYAKVNGKTYSDIDKTRLSMFAFTESLKERVQIYYAAMMVLDKLVDSTSKIDSTENILPKLRVFEKVINSGEFEQLLESMFNATASSFFDTDFNRMGDQGVSKQAISDMAVGLDILADVLSVFSTSLSGFDVDAVTAFNKALDVLARLATALIDSNMTQDHLDKAFNGDHTLSKVGFELKRFGGYVQSFYDSIKDLPGFKENEVAETTRKTNAIVKLVQDISNALANYLTYGRTSDMIDTVSKELPGLADTIAAFFVTVDEMIPKDLSVDRSEVLLNAVESTSNLISALSELRQWMLTSNTGDISKKINNLFTALRDNEGDSSTLSKLAGSVKLLHDALASAMSDEENLTGYEGVGDAIAHSLFKGIQNAFDTDPNLQVRITPILNIDENTKRQFNDAFSTPTFNVGGIARLTMGANNQTDQGYINSEILYAKIDKIDDVTAAIDKLAMNQVSVSDVTNAFASMRIVTDTGAMVGEITDDIDAAIGRKIWLIERGITAQ